jgi:hypothetical protein
MTRQQLTKATAFGALSSIEETAIDDHQTAALIDAASYRHGRRSALNTRQRRPAFAPNLLPRWRRYKAANNRNIPPRLGLSPRAAFVDEPVK